MLKWSGMSWDEGPGSLYEHESKLKGVEGHRAMGPHGPYFQSQRLPIYHKYVETLLENGDAYPCFCTAERLQEMRIQLGGQKYAKAKYDRFCLNNYNKDQLEEKKANGESYVIRMRIPKGKTTFKDIVHGKITFDNKEVDDQVILKNDGFPTYHFANVVDDFEMRISHVIRGEEWLPSTPKHLLLYKMFQIEPPQFAHLPLLLNNKGQKLSKRFGVDVSVAGYRDKGFLPEAVINGIALLGWNPPHREDVSMLQETTGVFMRHEVLSLENMID